MLLKFLRRRLPFCFASLLLYIISVFFKCPLFLRHLQREMEKRVAQGRIKAFLEQCSFFLVTWASCSYNREARHFNSVEAGCRLGSAGALGRGWWGLPRVLLPLIFISPAHGAGSPPKLQHQEGCDGGFCRTDQARLSLCGSWQEESWLSWLFERAVVIMICFFVCSIVSYMARSCVKCRQQEECTQRKTGIRLDPKLLPPLFFPVDALPLSELVVAV